jgi:hypothetical protein
MATSNKNNKEYTLLGGIIAPTMYFHSIAGLQGYTTTNMYVPATSVPPVPHVAFAERCPLLHRPQGDGDRSRWHWRAKVPAGWWWSFSTFSPDGYSENRSISQNVYMLQLHVKQDKQKKTKDTDDGKTISRTCTGGCFLAGALSVWPGPQSRRATCVTAGSAENEKVVSISPYVLSTGQEYWTYWTRKKTKKQKNKKKENNGKTHLNRAAVLATSFDHQIVQGGGDLLLLQVAPSFQQGRASHVGGDGGVHGRGGHQQMVMQQARQHPTPRQDDASGGAAGRGQIPVPDVQHWKQRGMVSENIQRPK